MVDPRVLGPLGNRRRCRVLALAAVVAEAITAPSRVLAVDTRRGRHRTSRALAADTRRDLVAPRSDLARGSHCRCSHAPSSQWGSSPSWSSRCDLVVGSTFVSATARHAAFVFVAALQLARHATSALRCANTNLRCHDDPATGFQQPPRTLLLHYSLIPIATN